MLLFWLTPIVYDLRAVPASLSAVLYLNPLSYFVLAYQDALYYNRVSPDRLVTILLLTVSSLALGYLIFVASKARFAEEV